MLQEKAADRKAALMLCNDNHNFMGMVRDLLDWSSGLRGSLITEEKVAEALLYIMKSLYLRKLNLLR